MVIWGLMENIPEKEKVEKQPKKNLGGATGKGWIPGQSGNPKGRPRKGNTYAEIIRGIGDSPLSRITQLPEDAQKTIKEAAIEAMWEKAVKGDAVALKILTDREAGYPRQSVEIDQRPKDTIKVIG